MEKFPFGIRSYLGNDVFGFLSVWEMMVWEKTQLGKYPTAIKTQQRSVGDTGKRQNEK